MIFNHFCKTLHIHKKFWNHGIATINTSKVKYFQSLEVQHFLIFHQCFILICILLSLLYSFIINESRVFLTYLITVIYINSKKMISSLRLLFVNLTEILKLITHKMSFFNHKIKPVNFNTLNKAFAELDFEVNHSLQIDHPF